MATLTDQSSGAELLGEAMQDFDQVMELERAMLRKSILMLEKRISQMDTELSIKEDALCVWESRLQQVHQQNKVKLRLAKGAKVKEVPLRSPECCSRKPLDFIQEADESSERSDSPRSPTSLMHQFSEGFAESEDALVSPDAAQIQAMLKQVALVAVEKELLSRKWRDVVNSGARRGWLFPAPDRPDSPSAGGAGLRLPEAPQSLGRDPQTGAGVFAWSPAPPAETPPPGSRASWKSAGSSQKSTGSAAGPRGPESGSGGSERSQASLLSPSPLSPATSAGRSNSDGSPNQPSADNDRSDHRLTWWKEASAPVARLGTPGAPTQVRVLAPSPGAPAPGARAPPGGARSGCVSCWGGGGGGCRCGSGLRMVVLGQRPTLVAAPGAHQAAASAAHAAHAADTAQVPRRTFRV